VCDTFCRHTGNGAAPGSPYVHNVIGYLSPLGYPQYGCEDV
jgi:hypothetical protein